MFLLDFSAVLDVDSQILSNAIELSSCSQITIEEHFNEQHQSAGDEVDAWSSVIRDYLPAIVIGLRELREDNEDQSITPLINRLGNMIAANKPDPNLTQKTIKLLKELNGLPLQAAE